MGPYDTYKLIDVRRKWILSIFEKWYSEKWYLRSGIFSCFFLKDKFFCLPFQKNWGLWCTNGHRIRNKHTQIDFGLAGFVIWRVETRNLPSLCQNYFGFLRKCLLKLAKMDLCENWKKEKKKKFLGQNNEIFWNFYLKIFFHILKNFQVNRFSRVLNIFT